MNHGSGIKLSATILVTNLLTLLGCMQTSGYQESENVAPVEITEWAVPWEQTRPRDPYVDQQNRVWFVGQRGDYLARLNPETGKFQQYMLDPGTGPHNLIVDSHGRVWYAGNRASHIGTLDPDTGKITKYDMPDPTADDPHTLIFGVNQDIWFTVQQSNFIGHLAMGTGEVTLMPLPTSSARPYGIVVDRGGTPWFTEFGTNKIGTIDPATQSVREIQLPRKDARPRRLAAISNNSIWYVDYAGGYLGQLTPATGKIWEWRMPGGEDSRPYGMTADDQDRVWFVETGAFPNRLIGFDTKTKKVISMTGIKSGAGTVRHMVFHQPTQTIWFGTDANTIGRAKVPE